MMDRQWLTGDGVRGQTIRHVHIPVGVVYSTKHEPAQIPRKYVFVIWFNALGRSKLQS